MGATRPVRTRIVCTIGPATDSPETLERLVRAGMNVARLNFSHGTREEHGRTITAVRAAAARVGRPVAVMQDLAGPKVRIGAIGSGTVTLEAGQVFTITSRSVPGDSEEVSVTYRGLPGDVSPGDVLLLSDGALELAVEETSGEDILCRVIVGGPLSSHKGINLPAGTITAPVLTEKDREDLAFGIERGVDFVALSFVRTADDVALARRAADELGRRVPLIAKIEKHEALDHVDEILESVDAMMIARGDLGVEIPIERVPRVQKMLIAKANSAAKPVITATQMLGSMVDNPRPTRAEVTDVANAILDGSDAVMLSEETAIGRYPVDAVRMMAPTAEDVESEYPFRAWDSKFEDEPSSGSEEAIAHSACRIAERTGAAAIITLTQSGSTARLVAKYRPRETILAVTPSEATYRSLSLVWGTVPLLVESSDDYDANERRAIRLALESGFVPPGGRVVITAGLPLHVPGTTNSIKVVTADSA